MKISIYNVNDQPIGRGGMGQVYLGTDPQGNRVAVKRMHPELTADANLRAFFHKEVNTLMQLEHSSIVKMYASFEERGNLYMVMEYVEGETIEQYVQRCGKIGESEAISLFVDILPAVGFVHQRGFVHRDIKPGNIIIKPDGKVCLLDFGIVKDMKNSTGHTVSQIIGSDGYMSPEQANAMSIDYRSDIYSLGCVLYYMLVGNHAIQKQSNDHATRMTIIQSAFPKAQCFNPGISDFIQKILDKATNKNMLQRFQSCREFELEISGGGTIFPGNQNTVSVGKINCDVIVPSHPKVSRHHLDIIRQQDPESTGGFGKIFIIRDRSMNGTVINGKKIQNGEKTIKSDSNYPWYPEIFLAGEVKLEFSDVIAALDRKQNATQPPVTTPPTPKPTPAPENKEETLSFAWGLLAFLFPIIGWIMYYQWKDEEPKKAKQTNIVSIIGCVTWYLIYQIIRIESI